MDSMLDNFEKLAPLLDFSGGNYVQLQVVRRLKDIPGDEKFRTSMTDYYFGSRERLEIEYPNIRAAADGQNARIYVSLNPVALSEPFKELLRKTGNLYGDKPLYGLAEGTRRYLLYDADRGEELRSAPIWNRARALGLALDRFSTVTGEGFILHACDYAQIFGTKTHFYPDCFALLYYKGQPADHNAD